MRNQILCKIFILLNLFQDINDELPTFRSREYVGEINENSQKGTPVTFVIR